MALVVEDDPFQRAALTRVLGRRFRVKSAATAADAREIITSTKTLKVALIDVGLPDGERGGLSLLEWIRSERPAIAALVVTASFEMDVAVTVASLGAYFLPKPLQEGALESWLRQVDSIDLDRLEGLRAQFDLSTREYELLLWLVRGGSIATFAKDAGISTGTAKTYVQRLLSKTGAPSTEELIRLGTGR